MHESQGIRSIGRESTTNLESNFLQIKPVHVSFRDVLIRSEEKELVDHVPNILLKSAQKNVKNSANP